MNTIVKCSLAALCLISATHTVKAEDSASLEWRAWISYGIGGTTPLKIPAEIRKINSYSPGANLGASVTVTKMLDQQWGVRTGLRLDNCGMKTGVDVTNYHLTMNVWQPDGSYETKTGYYTGSIKNTTQFLMLQLPIEAVWRSTSDWELSAGAYIAYALHRKFEGQVYEGKIRDTPLTPIVAVSRAYYDYSDDLNKLDCGINLGASRRVWRQLWVDARLKLGLLNMLNSERRKVDMNTYNMYLNLGASYAF